MLKEEIRIHGDNILECEHALNLLAEAINNNGPKIKLVGGSAYAPVYQVVSDAEVAFEVQLFPGYGRWGFDFINYLMARGALLREATDAIITRLVNDHGKLVEDPILAMEFCGALPAGNNAWQRCGRALSSAFAKIPYIYYAELGGLELDSERNEKASRFPNPLIPFAYLSLGQVEESPAIPVFIPSPSARDITHSAFNDCFGEKESLKLIRNIIFSESFDDSLRVLQEKAEKVVEILSNQRKGNDVLSPKDFSALKNMITGNDKANWLIKKKMAWNKKTGIKTLSVSFKKLLKTTTKLAVAIGSKDMPLCLISAKDRPKYADNIASLYGSRVSNDFLNWMKNSKRPLLCVWIAGFKPRGDDSRPDRGLVPLGRMIFGKDDVDILSIIYGPAKESTWVKLSSDIKSLSKINGLWEAVLGLSNALIVDSSTSGKLSTVGYVLNRDIYDGKEIPLPAANQIPVFGEHDVDSLLHLFFSRSANENIYEGLCNPPGGDWSGISICDSSSSQHFKWTSLPRVSGDDTKRPDHLFQFISENILLAVESKDKLSSLEEKIGQRLTEYIDRLIAISPISQKKPNENNWRTYNSAFTHKFLILSGGAIRIDKIKDLASAQVKGQLDVVFGVDFNNGKHTKLYILLNDKAEPLRKYFIALSSEFKNMVEVELLG